MTMRLFFQALTKYVVGLAIVMLLLFIPAGTLSFWQAWLFIGILFVPMLIVGIVLMSCNLELLRKRIGAGKDRYYGVNSERSEIICTFAL